MRSFPPIAGQSALAQQFINLRRDAAGGANLLVHQQLGFFTLSTNPTNTKTLTLDINGTNVVFTFVTAIGSTAGNVLIGASAAATAANLLALLNQPQTTTATGVALASANQLLVSYLSYALSGTTLTVSSNSNALYAPLTSFSASTTATSDSWTGQTMQLYVEPGVVYVNGTRVIFAGASTPTVTAPSSHPRIDVLTVDSSGTLAWTTGTENASPSAPSYPANKAPLIELWNVVSETALYDNDNQQSGQGYVYNDVRSFLQYPFTPSAIPDDLIPDGDGTRNLGSGSFEWNNLYVKSGIFLNGASINSQLLSSLTAAESISAGAPVAAGFFQTDGGVKFDTSASQDQNGGLSGTSMTQAITIGNNSNRILIVTLVGTAGVSGVTAGGTSMTQVDQVASPSWLTTYILVAPTVGSINVVASGLSNGQSYQLFIHSYYNAAQTSQPHKHSATAGTSASVTPTIDGCLIYGVGGGTSAQELTGIAYNMVSITHSTSAGSNEAGDAGLTVPSAVASIGSASGSIRMAIMAIAPFSSVSYAYVVNASSAASSAYSQPTNTNYRSIGFIGFAVSSVSATQTLSIVSAGIVTGLSGLTPFADYYLNDTAGTIGLSPGTNTRKIGIAISSTALLITNIW